MFSSPQKPKPELWSPSPTQAHKNKARPTSIYLSQNRQFLSPSLGENISSSQHLSLVKRNIGQISLYVAKLVLVNKVAFFPGKLRFLCGRLRQCAILQSTPLCSDFIGSLLGRVAFFISLLFHCINLAWEFLQRAQESQRRDERTNLRKKVFKMNLHR
jgi:hypothetical protein